MSGLLSCSPSPMAVRLCVSATMLLFTHLAFVLLAPAVTGAVKMLGWIVGVVALAAFGLALFGTWPAASQIWGGRDDR
ncbi:hypothetical protein [Sphingomonas immobilis]|uniref:Uncharacterized protein n=1 Tax=Sphingomonas immobilis TaxID=3063997 RepID=A0ABT8ZVZ4_9SPHN|nr:hypothetical protein [Sphingomonas sp. CA1-15]MDO7841734.1 hypothetical protein [Sphingomonas sp. CA1-15]